MIFKLFLIFNCLVLYTHALVRIPLKKRIIKPNDVQLSADFPTKKLPFQGAEVVIEINVGNQTFNVLLDTTSSNFWVASSKCSTGFCKHVKNKLNSNSNETFNNDGIHGTVTKQPITLNSFKVDSVDVVAADSVDISLANRLNTQADGVLGLNDLTLFNLYSPLKPDCLFSINLSDNSSKAGFYFGIPKDLTVIGKDVNITPYYITSLSKNAWKIRIDYVTNTMGDWQMWCLGGCVAVIDSTFNGISGPPSDINSINKFIGADDDGNIECWKKNWLDSVNFVIGGTKHVIEPKYYILEGDSKYSSKCKSAFTVDYTYNNQWRLGVPFMKKFLNVFDFEDRKITFLKLK